MRANGFKHAVNVHEWPGSGGDSTPHHQLHVIVHRPTELEATCVLQPDVRYVMPRLPFFKRLMWKPDPDDPNQERELDLEVDVDPLHGFAINDLVAHSGVRAALLLLAPLDSKIHLGFVEDAIKVDLPMSKPLPEGGDVLRLLFLVSLYRDRLKL